MSIFGAMANRSGLVGMTIVRPSAQHYHRDITGNRPNTIGCANILTDYNTAGNNNKHHIMPPMPGLDRRARVSRWQALSTKRPAR